MRGSRVKQIKKSNFPDISFNQPRIYLREGGTRINDPVTLRAKYQQAKTDYKRRVRPIPPRLYDEK